MKANLQFSYWRDTLVLLFCLWFTHSTDAQAQVVQRFALLEHFTNASCPPCAQQNPIFSAYYNLNKARAHHIAYHTSWPGADPMYNANPDEVDTRVGYYNIGGVPTVVTGGLAQNNSADVNDAVVNGATIGGSPIAINVNETTEGTQRNVTIDVKTVSAVPAGNWKIRAAIVERIINYPSAPGTNGEKDFPNVFRRMLINGTNGATFEAAPIGETATFTYDYTLNGTWNANNIYVIAFIQNETTKEVLNSGSSFDWKFDLYNQSNSFVNTESADPVYFNNQVTSGFDTDQYVQIDITTNAPDDWNAAMVIDGNEFDFLSLSTLVPAGGLAQINLKVTPGSSRSIAKYTLKISNLDDPLQYTSTDYYINNGAEDLVLNKNTDHEPVYIAGLQHAANTRYGSLAIGEFSYLAERAPNMLESIKHLYANIGWAYNTFDDTFVEQLANMMDSGVNLFISGQDIGWDLFDPSGTGTPAQREFYTNYLHAEWLDDGGNSNSSLTHTTGDDVFAEFTSSLPITNSVYGSDSFFPDQIAPADANATAIFNYNNSDRIAAIRAEADDYKVVYLGIGIEMLQNDAQRNELVKTVHDWFHGEATATEFDAAIRQWASCSPNPAASQTTIRLPQSTTAPTNLQLTDMLGKVVWQQTVPTGTLELPISVAQLPQGLYICRINSTSDHSIIGKLNVVR